MSMEDSGFDLFYKRKLQAAEGKAIPRHTTEVLLGDRKHNYYSFLTSALMG
jgi:hypothetical protein